MEEQLDNYSPEKSFFHAASWPSNWGVAQNNPWKSFDRPSKLSWSRLWLWHLPGWELNCLVLSGPRGDIFIPLLGFWWWVYVLWVRVSFLWRWANRLCGSRVCVLGPLQSAVESKLCPVPGDPDLLGKLPAQLMHWIPTLPLRFQSLLPSWQFQLPCLVKNSYRAPLTEGDSITQNHHIRMQWKYLRKHFSSVLSKYMYIDTILKRKQAGEQVPGPLFANEGNCL